MWADSGPTRSKNGGKASSKDIPNTTHVLHTHSLATCMPNIHVFYKGHHHRHVQDPLSTSPFSWLYFGLHLATIFQAILHTCLHILVSVSIIVSTCMFIQGNMAQLVKLMFTGRAARMGDGFVFAGSQRIFSPFLHQLNNWDVADVLTGTGLG
jgi:hypothetical protein